MVLPLSILLFQHLFYVSHYYCLVLHVAVFAWPSTLSLSFIPYLYLTLSPDPKLWKAQPHCVRHRQAPRGQEPDEALPLPRGDLLLSSVQVYLTRLLMLSKVRDGGQWESGEVRTEGKHGKGESTLDFW